MWRAISCASLIVVTGCGWSTRPRESTSLADAEVQALAPKFSLPNDDGSFVSLDELLAEGPAVLVFYRGHW